MKYGSFVRSSKHLPNRYNMTLPDDFWEQFDERLNKAFDRFEKRLDERFDRLEKRFDVIDAKFDKMEAKFDKIDANFKKMDAKINTNLDKLVNWTKGIDYDDPINLLK